MFSVRKTIPIVIGILILTGTSGFQYSPVTVQLAEAEPSKRIVGYFPYWESGDVDSIDYLKLTDIIYFHIWPNEDGTLDTSAVNENDLHIIRDNAHAVGVNVLIAVGGWGVSESFPAMADDPASRANFVSSIADYISANNLDGVDIDWETQIDPAKIDNLDILLSDLSNTLHPMGKIVTVAANADVLELKASAENSVDWVNVMAYDMNWGNAEHSTFADALEGLERYENEGISKEKLSLGIPFYGRDDNTNAIKYEDVIAACNPLPSENYCNGYFFNGIDLVKQKSQHVLDNGYYGVMIWNLGQDTYDQTSLLNSIFEVLDESPLPDMPPIANNDNYAIEAKSTLSIPSHGVLTNDSDPNNDPMTAVLDSTVSDGVLTLNADGSFSYSPDSEFDGVDSFTYHANDGTNNSNIATATIIVNPTSNIHLENLEITNSGNKRWTGTATITVFDENESPFSEAVVFGIWSRGSSESASCVTDSGGKCKVSQSTRGDYLTFTVDDISAINANYNPISNIVDNSITINKDGTTPGENTAPIANTGGPYIGIIDEIIVFDGSGSSDPDGDSLTYLWDFGDGNAGNVVTSSHTYTSDGNYNVILEVMDSNGATDTSSTTVTITSQENTDLTITKISPNSMIKGQTITVTISGNGFDQNSNVKFGGDKWIPTVISTTFIDTETIDVDVTRGTAGPNKNFVYDVTVTNSFGDSFTLPDSFVVKGQ